MNKDKGAWELYNLDQDRTELDDRAKSETERLEKMTALWNKLVKEIGGPRRRGGNNNKPK